MRTVHTPQDGTILQERDELDEQNRLLAQMQVTNVQSVWV
jgi:hypothetical protein